MAKKKLTDLEKRFLAALYSQEAMGDYQKARELAGYPETTPINQIVDSLADEIKDYTYKFLTLNSAKAAITMVDALNGDKPVSRERFKASTEVLDRAGIVKREQIDVHHEIPNAVIILPAKDI